MSETTINGVDFKEYMEQLTPLPQIRFLDYFTKEDITDKINIKGVEVKDNVMIFDMGDNQPDKEAENRTKEIIDYLNTCKKNVMIVSPDAPFCITTGKQQPDTSVHQMD